MSVGSFCRSAKVRSSIKLLLLLKAAVWSGAAIAYIGDSYLLIPGSPGHSRDADHKGWIRAEGSDWQGRLPRMNSGSNDPLAGDKLFFGGPNAPKPGNYGKLALALSRSNPDLPALMAACNTKQTFAQLTYAESSDRARPVLELGPRPTDFPAFWRYRLKDVQVVDCPVVEGATDQVVVLAFQDIEWLNYDAKRPIANRLAIKPAEIPQVTPVEPSGRKQVKSFLVTWIAPATDVPDEFCPRYNAKPSEADIFRYMTPEEVAKVKAQARGKPITSGPLSENRGPHRLSVATFPGIVPDPGLAEPNNTVADGIDLDGDDGSGKPPRGIRKHGNFTSPDGRTGIDNQFLRVWGCVTGFRGKRGYNNQTPNARRADGNITTLIEVSDVDDPKNDDTVYVAFIHSMDKPVRDNSGKVFIPDYTYRPTDDPNFALFNMRVRARLKDGVITSDVLPQYTYNPGQGMATTLYRARIRLEPQADGSIRGLLAGYQDWRHIVFSGYSEGLFNFQAPAVYYSLKRNADGLQDPLTGEFNGISTVFEIDTTPAFLTPHTTTTKAQDGKSRTTEAAGPVPGRSGSKNNRKDHDAHSS